MKLTKAQVQTLRDVVDTVCPSLPHPDDRTGFWATPGSATGAVEALQYWIEEQLPADVAEGLGQLLDGLGQMSFSAGGQNVRETQLDVLCHISREARIGVSTITAKAASFAYSVTDDNDRNVFWEGIGYPGPPPSPRPDAPAPIEPYVPSDGQTLECDVVVVGSGAGGGTIAGTLATQGKRVIVLEAAGYYSERDFRQTEHWANTHLYYGGGPTGTREGNVLLFAGTTLGGGTTINWQDWVLPTEHVRAEWASYGLDDVATAEWDRHMSAVMRRVNATPGCSDLNGPHKRLTEGAGKLGWVWRGATRNVDAQKYDPACAGYVHFGDVSGAKNGTLKTYLQDAYDHGARILTRTRAEEIITANGRGTGVKATYTDPVTGERAAVTVLADDVVVACGALETPALLLRSSIGGPAVGKYLHVHPGNLILGEYEEEQEPWWGPPQAAMVHEFADKDGNGYLLECSHFYTGTWASLLGFNGGRDHKERMSRLRNMALFLFILRDRGTGEVTIDENGKATHSYPFDDELDVRHYYEGIGRLVRAHAEAGASRVHPAVRGIPPWNRGEDLEAFIEKLHEIPVGVEGYLAGSAHQMSSARMGSDPQTSVADQAGQLHDTRGVWIGDTSAFPTASGANPMASCMTFARRTAENILGHRLPDEAATATTSATATAVPAGATAASPARS
ncbi:FAD-dependent oxidoreductase [Phytoactinopolyspora endophytica]|uniref:FAD-dependent oxidoreductase n=1 Tax=Phytoactinopolyspora endophytica TaxID=1642495 RepID=UPI0013EC365A|nr:FAD-dependent oxidoreductase [Phytoactinopolyspora endophytica]